MTIAAKIFWCLGIVGVAYCVGESLRVIVFGIVRGYRRERARLRALPPTQQQGFKVLGAVPARPFDWKKDG